MGRETGVDWELVSVKTDLRGAGKETKARLSIVLQEVVPEVRR